MSLIKKFINDNRSLWLLMPSLLEKKVLLKCRLKKFIVYFRTNSYSKYHY